MHANEPKPEETTATLSWDKNNWKKVHSQKQYVTLLPICASLMENRSHREIMAQIVPPPVNTWVDKFSHHT